MDGALPLAFDSQEQAATVAKKLRTVPDVEFRAARFDAEGTMEVDGGPL